MQNEPIGVDGLGTDTFRANQFVPSSVLLGNIASTNKSTLKKCRLKSAFFLLL